MSWLGLAAARGILTTRYPDVPVAEEELPRTGHGPAVPGGGRPPADAVAVCPVEAIDPDGIDQGRCIRCARCFAHGVAPDGRAEAATLRRADLTGGPAESGSTPNPEAPLARLGRSLHVFLIDVGSCGACNQEVLAIANPFYDLQRLGIFFTNSPRHADVLLVVGVLTDEMRPALERTYAALPSPKAVVAVGACPISGGVFRGHAGLQPSVDAVAPVDVFVPGCPPAPVQVLDALLRLGDRSRVDGGGR
ncbi:MAG TPA: hydrogenase [Thermoplasmata archaeon]|nr:hydrogenase [Thermoplasmata archaeon]